MVKKLLVSPFTGNLYVATTTGLHLSPATDAGGSFQQLGFSSISEGMIFGAIIDDLELGADGSIWVTLRSRGVFKIGER